MEKNSYYTEIVFRKFSNGEVIALMPYQISTGRYITSYVHVGQHGDADYNAVINNTKAATEEEYYALKCELESIGYRIQVITKKNNRKFLQAYREAHK
jgi:hypothetical protein